MALGKCMTIIFKKTQEDGNNIKKQTVKCTYSMKKALLFQNEMKTRPVEAIKALKKEVIKALKINIWPPVHPEKSNHNTNDNYWYEDLSKTFYQKK
jgi:hypothetical protein